MARGISLADNMLASQGILDRLDIDMVLYDVSGETPCTGYILPIREGVMDRCIIVTNGSFAAMTTANSILQAVLRAADGRIPVQLLVNNASSAGTREEVACYAQRANIEILGTVDHAKELKHSSLAGRTIFADLPGSAMAACFDQLADNLLAPAYPSRPVPFGRQELLHWLRGWQRRELERLREESHV